MKRALFNCILISMVLLVFYESCQRTNDTLERKMLQEWGQHFSDLEESTPGFTVPVSSRMYAYVHLTAYLAACDSRELNEEDFQKMKFWDKATFSVSTTHSALAVNTAYARIAELFFANAKPDLIQKTWELEQFYRHRLGKRLDDSVKMHSISHGILTAHKIWQYSQTDSLGHDAFLYNYRENYNPPNCFHCWKQTGKRPMPALLPQWGNVRTFLVPPNAISIDSKAIQKIQDTFEMIHQAQEIYILSQDLNKNEQWIAEFWSDDQQGQTITAAGRWFSIARQAATKSKLDFHKNLKLNLIMGLCFHDLAVAIWHNKYQHHLVRPETLIQSHFSKSWFPYLSSPNFPSFPSGHAAFGAAAELILSAYFGSEFKLKDRTHQTKKEFDGRPRTFTSFKEMATENAYSRMLGGIHYRIDCESGMQIGYDVAGRYFKYSQEN